MPTRDLPNSDLKRTKALDGAKKKYDLVIADGGTPAFSATLYSRLGNCREPFATAINDAGMAQHTQSELTNLANSAATVLRRFISHFIQVFDLGIERGLFPAADRAFYLLPVSTTELPPLDTQADLLLWAGRVVQGETNRLLAHPTAKAMDLPSAAEVQTAWTAYDGLDSQQSTAKSANDLAEEAIAALRPEVDETIRKIWNDIEHTFEDDTPQSLRRKSREYGITYALRPGETEDPVDPVPPVIP